MRKHLFTLGVVAVAALLAIPAFAANRGVEFTGIGFHPDPGPWPASAIYSMNPEGTIFMASPSAWGNYCFQWTMEDGWAVEVGDAGSVCWISSTGEIAADGANYTIMDYWPGYWLGTANTWDFIPDAGGDTCGSTLSMHGASDNLDYLVGLGWEGCTGRRFVYDRNTDTAEIRGCIRDDSCRLNDVTNDGSKMVGWNTSECGAWRGAQDVGGSWEFLDGLGDIDKKVCTSGGPCCGNNDCPEFVDAYCDEQCIDGFCGPGPNEGNACTSNWQCDGYCVNGPNHGQECTSSYYCPDVPACVENPEFDPMIMTDWKGEAYKVTPDGDYVLGYNYGQSPYTWSDPEYDPELFASAYRQNPDGSYTQIGIPPGASPYDSWTPLFMSNDGNVVVGRYGWWIYSFPTIWTPYTGTLDFQYFLVAQGLDELWFWYLSSLNAVSADGHVLAGYGSNLVNPDCPLAWGCQEGFVVDISKVKVCHAPGGDPSKERTLTIALESAGDHVGHGDFLGTCEFKNSGGRSRAMEQFNRNAPASEATPADYNPMIGGPNQAFQPRREGAAQQAQPERHRVQTQRSRDGRQR